MKLAIPRSWRETTDHTNNCFFYMVDHSISRAECKYASAIIHQIFLLSIASMAHCPELYVSIPPKSERLSPEENSNSESNEVIDPDLRRWSWGEIAILTQPKNLNDLIKDLGLIKSKAVFLTPSLKQWDLLDESLQISISYKASPMFFYVFQLSRRFLLLPQCDRSVWGNWNRL